MPDYEQLEPIPSVYGYATIISSVLFFQAVNQVIFRCVPCPEAQAKEGKESIWKWRNLVISWIHAVIVGSWDLTCFYWYPELMTDLVAYHNIYLYTMVAFSTGYFIHDFIDIVVNKNLAIMWEVIPHHFAVAGMFFYNVIVSRCIAYNVVALLAEVNTIFLHTRKLLQMARVPYEHWLYRINSGVNLVTFVFCRFSGLIVIVVGMCIWGHRVSPTYFVILASSMFVMWVTNIMLFWRLLSSDLIRPCIGRRSKHTSQSPSSSLKNGSIQSNGVISNGDHENGGLHHRITNGIDNNNREANGTIINGGHH